MGLAKQAIHHPHGGSWGGHLVGVFETAFPSSPILLLGDALPDRPDLPRMDDPREGPAVALRAWAFSEVPAVDRWWVVACDQVRWTPERLLIWAADCEREDALAQHWVMAHHGGHLQPLGGWLPATLRSHLAASTGRSLLALAEALPHLVLPRDGDEWSDVDTPEERARFEAET